MHEFSGTFSFLTARILSKSSGCDYFLSTDDRLPKYQTDEIILINPVDFIKDVEVG